MSRLEVTGLLIATCALLPLPVVAAGCSERYLAASTHAFDAHAARAAADYSKASKAALLGLDRLGDAYVSANVIDDTGQTLVLADIQAREGKEKLAADMRVNILDARLEQYRRSHKDCVSSPARAASPAQP